MSIEVRELYVMGTDLYAVSGSTWWKISSALAKTAIQTLTTSTGAAYIVGDGTNLACVDGVKGYSFNGTSAAEITFPDTFAPSSLTFQDGYYIVSKASTGRFYISTLNDPTLWDASDYATAEGLSDNLVRVFSHNRDLWLFGQKTTEIWYNSGSATFPFDRYQGGFIKIGLKAPRSVAASDERVFWLDDDLRVRSGIGVQSEIISTPQIDYQISLLTSHADAVGFFYMHDGHGFYQISFPTKTLVYDASTNFWHSRAVGDTNTRHPAQCYAWWNDLHVVGHKDNGKILYFDPTYYTNDGEKMIKIRTAQAIHKLRNLVFQGTIDVEFEAGVANSECAIPYASLEFSDDFANTWSAKRTVSIGAAGEYKARAKWRRLGASRSRLYRITVEDPVKTVILGAHMEAEGGRH